MGAGATAVLPLMNVPLSTAVISPSGARKNQVLTWQRAEDARVAALVLKQG